MLPHRPTSNETRPATGASPVEPADAGHPELPTREAIESAYDRRGPLWLRAALAQQTEGVIATDANGRIIFVNEAAARLHGVVRLDVLPDRYADSYRLLTEDGAPYPSADLPLARAAMRGETVLDARWRIRRPDGSEVLAIGSARPLLDDSGGRVGALLTLRDDTVRAAGEARLAAQAAELQVANAMLQEQATELEATTEALQEQASELEITNLHLQEAQHALKQQAAELAEREARWHTLTEAMPQLVWTSRADGYVDFCNQRWLDYTGQRQAETWGRGWLEAMHPDDRQPTLAIWESAVARGESFESYYRLRRASDGAYRWFLSRAVPQREQGEQGAGAGSGRVVRWFGSCTDVHEQRSLAEERERLLGAEREARAAAEAAAVRERFLAHASELLAESLDTEATLRQVAALAVPTLADWCALDLVSADGRLERLAVCHPDPARVALAYALDARYPEDPDRPQGRYAVLRSGEPEWMAEIPDALIEAGARDAEHLQIIRALQLRSYIAAPLAGRDGVHGVLTLVAAESGRRYTEADVQLAVELARRAAVAIENARLVSALRASETQLQAQAAALAQQKEELEATTEALQHQTESAHEARRAAEEANRAKTEFLTTMSHELRTPLNAIGGYAELLSMELRGPVNEAQRDDLDRIRRSGQHLLGLINDILNFAKLEAGQVEIRPADVPASAMIAEVEPLIAPQMQARGLAFEASCAEPGLVVRADAEKVRQVLLNLLTNALKFTEPGGRVALSCDDGGSVTRFTVRDTGRGIPSDQLERVFEPFVQVDRHRTHASQQGIGLGLAISRDLARAMGGELRAESVEGLGSAFVLTLPTASRRPE